MKSKVKAIVIQHFFREYGPRIGKWLSLDPKAEKYPGQSAYVAFNNNPIYHNDPRDDDPPKGFKKHTNTANGTEIYLPGTAKVELFKGKQVNSRTNAPLNTKDGTIRAFNIGNQRFVAPYDQKGNFVSYNNSKTGKAYTSPDIKHTSGD